MKAALKQIPGIIDELIIGPQIIEVDLSFMAFEAEYLKGKVDIDKILFRNKTILDLVRMVRNKIDDRDKELNGD